MEHEFLFDVKLLAEIRVKARSESEARRLLMENINPKIIKFGGWPNRKLRCEELISEGDDPLLEVDGQDTDDDDAWDA